VGEDHDVLEPGREGVAERLDRQAQQLAEERRPRVSCHGDVPCASCAARMPNSVSDDRAR
jgi:hypothetical protein